MDEISSDEKQRLAGLTEIFRRLGAHDPEAWARSEVGENIPQLARFLFLRSAWQYVLAEDDAKWIDAALEHAAQRPNDPCAGIGPALQRLLNLGANRQDLTDIVRVKQYETLFGLCYLLAFPERLDPELGEIGWLLEEVDSHGQVTGRLVDALHESVLSMDPTGREMRPRREMPYQ